MPWVTASSAILVMQEHRDHSSNGMQLIMAVPTLELQGLTIVLLGAFNPQIFQPAWFAAENLIRKEEAEATEIKVIHPEIVSTSTDWLQLQVRQDRFIASTTYNSFYEPLRDLVLGTFRLLRHTPIQKMGVNRDFHFRMPSEDTWHALGDRLAPKEPWINVLEKPGMRRLDMESPRLDDFQGYIRVRTEPSVRYPPGVYIHVNDHYEVQSAEPPQGCDEIMTVLSQVWKVSVDRAERIAHTLLESI
jgi:hypothetical protein